MGDLFLRNARIWTGVAASPWAAAALIRDGRFVAVGRAGDIDAPAGVDVIDAGGRLVVPGFTDAHAHLLGVGAAKRNVDLKGSATVDEAVRRVAERVATTPTGGWVRGAGWDQNDWPGARFPHRRDLDAVAPDHAVVLMHTSGHCWWVNSAALRAANVDRDTPTPVGGAIDVDESGEPTGILFDAAARIVTDVVPPPTAPERLAALRDGVAHAHRSASRAYTRWTSAAANCRRCTRFETPASCACASAPICPPRGSTSGSSATSRPVTATTCCASAASSSSRTARSVR